MSAMFLVRSLDYGGAERQVVETCKGLVKSGYQVSVAEFYSGGPLEKELVDAGVPVVSLDKKGRWDVLGFIFRTATLLRKAKSDVVYSYLVVPNIVTVALRPILPNTRIVWSVRASNMDYRQYDWLSRLTFKISAFLARFVDAIVVNSEAGRTFHREQGYPDGRMTVIRNGIDVKRFSPDRALGSKVRADWNVDPEAPLIGLVGRLDPMKDHASFLRAAALLAEVRLDARFVCIGEGSTDYAAELQGLAASLHLSDRLIWAGSRSDMPAVYNALDCLVLPSAFGEGFPNAVGEAMACAVPCIVTDVGDCRQIVGDTGLVVSPGDCQGLFKALCSMLGDPARSQRGMRARQRIVAEFSTTHMVQATLKVFCVGPAYA